MRWVKCFSLVLFGCIVLGISSSSLSRQGFGQTDIQLSPVGIAYYPRDFREDLNPQWRSSPNEVPLVLAAGDKVEIVAEVENRGEQDVNEDITVKFVYRNLLRDVEIENRIGYGYIAGLSAKNRRATSVVFDTTDLGYGDYMIRIFVADNPEALETVYFSQPVKIPDTDQETNYHISIVEALTPERANFIPMLKLESFLAFRGYACATRETARGTLKITFKNFGNKEQEGQIECEIELEKPVGTEEETSFEYKCPSLAATAPGQEIKLTAFPSAEEILDVSSDIPEPTQPLGFKIRITDIEPSDYLGSIGMPPSGYAYVLPKLLSWTYPKYNYCDSDSEPLSSLQSSPTIDENASDGCTIYFGSDDKRLYAVSCDDGILRWQRATGGAIKTKPVVGRDHTIYVTSDDKKLYATSSDGKTEKWAFPLENGDKLFSPAVYSYGSDEARKIAVIIGSGQTLHVVNGDSGQEACRVNSTYPITSSPTYIEQTNGRIWVFWGTEEELYSSRIDMLSEPWNCDAPKTFSLSPGEPTRMIPVIHGDTIYAAFSRKITAIRWDKEGEDFVRQRKWVNDKIKGALVFPTVVTEDGEAYLYVATSEGYIYKIRDEGDDDAEIWRFPDDGGKSPFLSAPAVVKDDNGDSRGVFVGNQGDFKVYGLDSRDGSPLQVELWKDKTDWAFTTGAQIVTTPLALWDKKALYLTSMDGYLYKLSLEDIE